MLRFYNTLTKQKEEFKPIQDGKVAMYSCGPTVYNYAHIGNLRSYVFADVLKRTLTYSGYEVTHVMNLTDIDDKTIKNSQKEGKTLKDFTEFYTLEFIKDISSLNILPPKTFTKATNYIDKMVEITTALIQKGYAYKSTDGSIYFDIKKFPNYGKLSNLVLDEQKENAGGRIKTDEYDKENVQDFALWKAYDEVDGEVFWETSLGKGRPGWHIECSAMAISNLGSSLDIHTGGVDNIFPHHENEIAQSECYSGEKFVNYWMHNEWVLADNKKMSKSEHNFFTLRDVISRDIDPIAYRFWLLMANYRTRVNFVWEALEASEIALKRLYRLYLDLGEEIGTVDLNYQKTFKERISDDLNTPLALSLLWDLVKDSNISNKDKKATILDFDKVFGLEFASLTEETIPEEIIKLAEERKIARANKDFQKSDELRDKIKSLGYEIKDSETGEKIQKI
ncbi:MAG: cysteine--tRNA ligase [Candidatus Paceibacterota bacterium]